MLLLPKVHFKEVFRDVLQSSPPVALRLPAACVVAPAQSLPARPHQRQAPRGHRHPSCAGVEGSAVHLAVVHQQPWGEQARRQHRAQTPLPQPLHSGASLSWPALFYLVYLKKKCRRQESFRLGVGVGVEGEK